MRRLLLAASLAFMFVAAAPAVALELKGEAFVIDGPLHQAYPGQRIEFGSGYGPISPVISEAANGDLVAFYPDDVYKGTRLKSTSLFLKILNSDGSEKRGAILLRKMTSLPQQYDLRPLRTSGVVSLSNGRFVAAYTEYSSGNKSIQLYAQKLNDGDILDERQVVATTIDTNYPTLNSALISTADNGMLVWQGTKASGLAPTRAARVGVDGDILLPPQRILKLPPSAVFSYDQGFVVAYKLRSKRKKPRRFAALVYDQNGKRIGGRTIVGEPLDVKFSPTNVLKLSDGNNVLIWERYADGIATAFGEVTDPSGLVIKSATQMSRSISSNAKSWALPGGGIIFAHYKNILPVDDVSKYKSEIKFFNGALEQVGQSIIIRSLSVIQVLPLRSGDALVVYRKLVSQKPWRENLMGQFISLN